MESSRASELEGVSSFKFAKSQSFVKRGGQVLWGMTQEKRRGEISAEGWDGDDAGDLSGLGNLSGMSEVENSAPLERRVSVDAVGNMEQILKVARGNPLFSTLTVEQCRAVVSEMFDVECVDDEIVISQGELGNHFYVVASGEYAAFVKGTVSRIR